MILQMSTEAVSQLIGSVGFPIVAFLLMFQLARSTIKENTTALRGLRLEMEKQRSNRLDRDREGD